MKFFIYNLSIVLIAVTSPSVSYAGFDFDSSPDEQVNVVPNSLLNEIELPIVENSAVAVVHSPPVSILKEEKKKPKAILHVFSKGNEETSSSIYDVEVASTAIVDRNYKHINVYTWKANEGEPLKDVIDRWSERSETGLVWGLAERKVVLESVSYFGKYEDALMHLFDKGMRGTVEGQLSYNDIAEKQDAMPSTEVQEVQMHTPVESGVSKVTYVSIEELDQFNKGNSSSLEKKWRINKQDDLKSTLYKWQKDGGYTLVWDYPYDINIEKELFLYGTVEEALNLLLDSYKFVGDRPVGNMYTDPNSGNVYLHVKKEE